MTITLSDPRYDVFSQVGYALGKRYGDEQQQKEYMQALQDVAKLRKEQQDLSKPNAAQNQATFDVANSDKYKYDIDQQHPDDENIKGMDQLLYGANKLANLKRTYALNNGNAEYQAQIAAAADRVRDSLTNSAQKYGLNISSDVSAEDYQKGLDALKMQRNQQATAWANSQNPGHTTTTGPLLTGTGVMPQQTSNPVDYLSYMNKDIAAKIAVLEQRQQELGVGSTNPEDQRIAVLNQLRAKGYSPETIINGLQYYDTAEQKQKAAQEEQMKKQALASVVKTLYSTKDPDARNTALIAYSLINGGKDAPEYYKAGIPEQVLQTTDLGNNTAFSMFNKKGNGSDLRTTLTPNGVKPDTIVKANTDLQMNANNNNAAIARANIEGNYALRRAGIDYQRAVDVAKMAEDGKLSPVDAAIVKAVSSSWNDPEKWEALNSADDGRQALQRFRQLAGTGTGAISDQQYDQMYNYYVNSGLSPDEAHKKIQGAFWK